MPIVMNFFLLVVGEKRYNFVITSTLFREAIYKFFGCSAFQGLQEKIQLTIINIYLVIMDGIYKCSSD